VSEPLTDEEIAARTGCPTCGCRLYRESGGCEGETYRAEVRRLRSDEWLEKAAQEIEDVSEVDTICAVDKDIALDILRKHRDGK